MKLFSCGRGLVLSTLALLLAVPMVGHAADEPAAATQKKGPQSTIAAPRDPGWVKIHEGYLAEGKAVGTQAKVVFVGDSITDEWHKHGKEVFAQCYAPLHALNLGIGGDQTQHVLWRLDNGELDGLKPKVVVVMIGTNNHDDSVDNIAAGVTAVVQDVRQKLPDSKILLLGIFPRGEMPMEGLRQKMKEVNLQLAKLDDGEHIKYLDIGAAFLQPDGTISRDVMQDFLHPTARGFVLWAQAMNPVLSEMLGEKIAPPEEKTAAEEIKPGKAE